MKRMETSRRPRHDDVRNVTDKRPEPVFQVKDEVASTHSAPRINALQTAEQQLIGALLRQPALFHHTLDDGKLIHDAVRPEDFVTQTSRRLYEQVYTRLSRKDHLSLRALVADLGSDHEQDLVDLATGTEADMERLCAGSEERLVVAFRGAAETIRGYHRDQDYSRIRGRLIDTPVGHDDPADGRERLLREMVQNRRENRHPARIGRKPSS